MTAACFFRRSPSECRAIVRRGRRTDNHTLMPLTDVVRIFQAAHLLCLLHRNTRTI
jgi:hypothetical protein